MSEEVKGGMLCLPYQVSETQYNVMLVLQDHNLERIKAYDPSCMHMSDLPSSLIDGLTLNKFIIGYGTEDEVQQIIEDYKLGQPIGPALERLHRGYQVRHDMGDGNKPIYFKQGGRG